MKVFRRLQPWYVASGYVDTFEVGFELDQIPSDGSKCEPSLADHLKGVAGGGHDGRCGFCNRR
jgi:hypothetical protein